MLNKADLSSFRCSHPIFIGNQIVPCGHCLNCRKSRINSWSTRLKLEYETYNRRALFITLTYSPEFLPSPTLRKKDLQDFFKRLRYRTNILGYKDIVYFACGEYGGQNKRPHFHIVLFGLPFFDGVVKLLYEAWQKKGFVDCKIASPKHFGYCAKYCVKTLNHCVDGVPEFVVMSRKQAIGSRYVDANLSDLMLSNFRIKFGRNECYVPRDLLRKKYKKQLESVRYKVVNFFLPDDYNLDNFVRDYYKYKLYYIHNIRRDFSESVFFDCDFRFFNGKDFCNCIDVNLKNEKEFCFKKSRSLHEFYNNNKAFFSDIFKHHFFLFKKLHRLHFSINDFFNGVKERYNPFLDAYFFVSYQFK